MPIAAVSSRPFVVAPHVRLCAIDEQVILLDLRVNRYVGLGGAVLGSLASLVEDWPLQISAEEPHRSDSAVMNRLEPLLARGWLIGASEHSSADDLPPVRLPEARRTVDEESDPLPAAAGSMRTLRCFSSAISASWSLRRSSLLANARQVARHRTSLRMTGDGSAQIVSVVSAYRRLRPLLFTARDRCLHDSLTLVRFLAAEGISAHWVIGVRIKPFAAHSWVQYDDVVLNDQHERVRAYHPILIV